MAVQVLWSLSGRQFGVCDYIARPCPNIPEWYRFRTRYQSPSVSMYFTGGSWMNYPCGCLGRCEVTNPRTVHLPGPVFEVTAVTIDDTLLPESEYGLEGNVLYRRGADWPLQDLSLPMGEDNTWFIEYVRGIPVPAGADRLTGLLAKEFMASCTGDKCRLPRTVTQVTRRGVSYVFDPTPIYTAGKTGLAEIDLWLSAVNPNKMLSPSTVV